jgi:hypothetical protein
MNQGSPQFSYADGADSVYDQLAAAGHPDMVLSEESGEDAVLASMLAQVDQEWRKGTLPIKLFMSAPDRILFALAVALLLEGKTVQLQRSINHEKGDHLIIVVAMPES